MDAPLTVAYTLNRRLVGSALSGLKRVKEAQRALNEMMEQPALILLIHYSCERLYDRSDGRSPRITSIAVRSLATGQTQSFSIHKVAEVSGVRPADIIANYDGLEREMLDEFFDFVRRHLSHRWVHWNMRNINFGFPAIEHRYRVLGGQPHVLDDVRKLDLSRLLQARYSDRYIGHPRLESLVRTNDITALNFLTGSDEADAFEKRDYVRLHQSTLRKVDVLSNILVRAADGKLKTDANWREVYGCTPEAVGEWLKEHWIATLLASATAVAGLVLGLMAL